VGTCPWPSCPSTVPARLDRGTRLLQRQQLQQQQRQQQRKALLHRLQQPHTLRQHKTSLT
jgi:hypothetical protein